MIKKSCKTCDYHIGGCWPCTPTDLRDWRPSRAALEAEVATLTTERDGLRTALDDARRGVEPPPSPPGGGRARPYLARIVELEKERDDLRAQVAARGDEIAVLRARVEDWETRYRELSDSVESERSGLRHSLSEAEAELEERRKERDEARAAAKVMRADAEQERKRLREGLP